MGSPIFLVFFPHAASDLLDGRWRRRWTTTLVVIDLLSKRSRVAGIAGNFFGCLFGRGLLLGGARGGATLLGYGFLFQITVIIFGSRLSTFKVLLLIGDSSSSPSTGALTWNGTVLFGWNVLFFVFHVFHHHLLGRRLVLDNLFGILLCRLARHGLLDGLKVEPKQIAEASKKKCQRDWREWRFRKRRQQRGGKDASLSFLRADSSSYLYFWIDLIFQGIDWLSQC
jgi:hypothetical protein